MARRDWDLPGNTPAPKRQTIRKDRKRHARPGEVIQLYCGMRTRQCFKIGEARCVSIETIKMRFGQIRIEVGGKLLSPSNRSLDEFARSDGFADWNEMVMFWREEHPLLLGATFRGVLIKWEPLP